MENWTGKKKEMEAKREGHHWQQRSGQWWAVAAMLGDMRLYLRQLPDSCGWWRPYRGAERAIDFGCNLKLVLESWERASHYFNCSNFVISPLIETYQLQPGTRQLQLHFLSP